ncbi:metal-dependent hydrolase [Metabacillus herbersteinensis]|uniref:Metal-dependent hydrolase n=1 Tax=Metabacillus herbersteinensis TaxID=283816 RepID=A0ABV6GIJ2_9BACI
MNGTAHTALGAATGFVVANFYQTDPSTTAILVGVGSIAGLIPDMDIDGKLSNKITFSHEIVRSVAQSIGFLMILYSFFEGIGQQKWLGIGVGIGIIVISSFIKQRHMLTITGAGVLAGGISLQESWLLLLGIYIILASFVAHRSYTHSVVGLLFFGFIAYQCQESLGITGLFATCLAGYVSHIVADMKVLPFNKRGVKLLLPFSKMEI